MKTYKQLYNQYLIQNEECRVSIGTFMALKPFYVKSATANDIEMCCCKKHLHARWSINALIDCAKAQNINIDFDSYDSFFNHLITDCDREQSTYLSWKCTPNKDELCENITTKWVNLKNSLTANSNAELTVNLMHFEKIDMTNKAGKTVERLKAISTPVNMKFILDLISIRLPKIIHHRNQLKHYRSCIKTFKEVFDAVSINIDFSAGEKTYHPYLSDDRKHNQVFVNIGIENMLNEAAISSDCYVIIERQLFCSV